MKRDLGFIVNRIIRWFYRFLPKKKLIVNEAETNNALDFVKLCGEWYADVPGWKGDLHQLTMVMGADSLLDYLSGGSKFVSLIISLKNNGGIHLEKLQDIYDGADYHVDDENCPVREIWLCQVNNLYWGGYAPDNIYFKVNYAHPNVNQATKYDNF